MKAKLIIFAAVTWLAFSIAPCFAANQLNNKEQIKLLASENGWDLTSTTDKHPRCTLSEKYKSGRASGIIFISRETGDVTLLVLQDGFSGDDTSGWVSLEFDVGAPIEKEIRILPGGAPMLDLKKRVADAFVDRFMASQKLKLDFKSWPEEYPASLTLPSSTIKQKWSDCLSSSDRK